MTYIRLLFICLLLIFIGGCSTVSPGEETVNEQINNKSPQEEKIKENKKPTENSNLFERVTVELRTNDGDTIEVLFNGSLKK
jgi:hypothetical protein